MRVLGIETSCDETGVAIYDTSYTGGRGLLADALYSQIAMHAEYGGVVPELASRDHTRKLLPLIEQVLHDAELTRGDLDGIAYTAKFGVSRRAYGGRQHGAWYGTRAEYPGTGRTPHGRPFVSPNAGR